jgi:hypothetical protein
MSRGGLSEMTYSGGRRRLELLVDRELAGVIDRLAEMADQSPEAFAVATLRRALLP